MTTLTIRQCLLLAALVLACASACNRGPHWLGPDDEVGDRFPDEEIDLEAERANPGHELHVPTDEEQANFRYCTREELAAIKAGGGRVTGKTLGCVSLNLEPEPLPPGQTRREE